MMAIPDTGPGLSGFLAHYLWLVYAHFPSTGRWDWLLLFLALGAAVHSATLHYLWKAVEANMAALREGKTGYVPRGSYWALLFCVASLGFFLWFFDTPAGRTFLDRRQLFGIMLKTDTRGLSDFSPILNLFVVGAGLSIVSFFLWLDWEERAKATGATKTQSFPTRDFFSLYDGGGVFVCFKTPSLELQYRVPFPFLHFAGGLEITFWLIFVVARQDWQATPLILLDCFLFFALITEIFRILFVYILHKRTFG